MKPYSELPWKKIPLVSAGTNIASGGTNIAHFQKNQDVDFAVLACNLHERLCEFIRDSHGGHDILCRSSDKCTCGWEECRAALVKEIGE